MDEFNLLQRIVEEGANLSNIAELFIFYRLLSLFSSRSKQVDDRQKEMGGEMEAFAKDVQIIKYELQQTNRLLAEIYGSVEKGNTSKSK